MYGVWLYYIQGTIQTFVNIDWGLGSVYGHFIVQTLSASPYQTVKLSLGSHYVNYGQVQPGWNFIMFGGSYNGFVHALGNEGVPCGSSGKPSTPNYYDGSMTQLNINKIGGVTCTDSSIQYVIHSISWTNGSDYYDNIALYNYLGIANTAATPLPGGNGILDSGETGDDSNTADGDGCDSSCTIESGFTGTGTPSVCSDIGGDGFVKVRSSATYGDDGNTVSGDGGGTLCSTQIEYTGSGGSATGPDTGRDKGGDGILITIRPNISYGDDGNSVNNDGCNNAGVVESGYTGTGAMSSSQDFCTQIGGDGIIPGTRPSPTYGDDGNSASGDGCDSNGVVESGFNCTGGTSIAPDVCYDKGADGVITGARSSVAYGDDGNIANGDGGDSTCISESFYSGGGGTTTSPDTGYDLCGDGIVYGARPTITYGDDGNTISGDGGSSNGETETSYEGVGGTISTPDIGTFKSGDSGYTYDEAQKKGIVAASLTTAVIGGSIMAASMSLNTASSLMSASSSQSIFASINQLQLVLLLVLFGVYLPGKVLNLIQSFNMTLLSFDIPSLPIFKNFSWFFSKFAYDQNDENLKIVGLKSGSTLINLLTPFITIFVIIVLHIIVGLLSLLYRKTGPLSGLSRFNKKLFNGLTFGAYIRVGLESFLVILLSGATEIKNKFENKTIKQNSIYSAYVMAGLLLIFFGIVLTNLIQRNKKDYFNSEIKSKFIARSYCFILLLRLVIFSSIVIFGPNIFFITKVIGINALQFIYVIYIILSRQFKTVKDNLIEITNELFYSFIIGILLYMNTKSRWSSMTAEAYVYIIMGNMTVVTLISISFMVKTGVSKRSKKIATKFEKTTVNNQDTTNRQITVNVTFEAPSSTMHLATPTMETDKTKHEKNIFESMKW